MRIHTAYALAQMTLATWSLFTNPTNVFAASNCPDSTETLEPIFGWDIPADGYDIVVGTNRLVYVTDPANDRICRYTLYGDDELCWESTDPPDPGTFHLPRWLAWNPLNSRVYVCGQLNTPARVPVFTADGDFLFDIESDTLSTQPGKFAGPVGPIAIDPVTGFVWVYENNVLSSVTARRIQEFDLDGAFTGRVFNIPLSCLIAGGGRKVEDMTVDSNGTVYMLERSANTNTAVVHRVNPNAGCITSFGNSGGPSQLTFATGIAIDKDGHVNVLEFNLGGKFVRRFNKAGAYISSQQIGSSSDAFSFGLEFMRDAADPFMFVAPTGPHRVAVYGMGIDPRNVLATSWVDDQTFQLETDDLEKLAECIGPQDPRAEMTGVAADGVAPLLLRLHLPESGTVRWKLADPNNPAIDEELGTLANLDSTQTGIVVDTAVESVEDEFIAFAVYRAPADFERPSVPADGSVGERALQITAEFMPNVSPDTLAIVRDLTIERPTVVFLHGYLESPESWKDFKSIVGGSDNALWGKQRIEKVNYVGSHGEGLGVNALKLQARLQSVSTSARRRRIASAQVDIVSHSMGGLVLRRLADATTQDKFKFRSEFNMGRGYYHKAMFLNVPHQGSPVADITMTLRGMVNSPFTPPRERVTAWAALHVFALMSGADYDQVVGDAVDDLSLGSDAVTNLQEFVAPTHAHVGTGGSDLWFTPELLKAAGKRFLLAYVGLLASITNLPELILLDTEVHDVAVLLDSQIGGLTSSNYYVTAGFENGLHGSAYSSPISGSRTRDWATRTIGDASFFAPSLPAGSSLRVSPNARKATNDLTHALQDEMPEFSGVTVGITNPGENLTLSSGDSVLVEVQPFRDVSSVAVTYPGGALFMDSTLAGYVPTDLAMNGPFQLSALALMADGTVGRSEPVTITVRPPLTVSLDGIEVSPLAVSLPGIGSVLELRVVGNYSDGVQRNIAVEASGITYTGFDPGVVGVGDGVLRGESPGATTIVVQKGAYVETVTVEVGDAPAINNAPHALAGGPYQICNGDGVQLDASNSFDPDGDQLTYAWDLNDDGQFGDLVGATAFYSPPYIADERLIGLRVSDSHGSSSVDYTAIQVPLSCFEGERICVAPVLFSEPTDLGADNGGEFYVLQNADGSGSIVKRDGTCALDETSFPPITDPADLNELAVDAAGIAYVIGSPDDEQILLFGPGVFGELDPLVPVFTTPYSLVTGIAVDLNGNLYGSDFDSGTQHVFIRKFDQAQPEANLLSSWNLTVDAGLSGAEGLSVAIGPDSAIFVGVGDEILKGVGQGGSYSLERRWGSSGLGVGEFRGVADVAVGPDGDVFVADYDNHRIQRFASDGTFRSMRKGTDGPDGRFHHPTAVIALDSIRVAVADFKYGGDPRVQVFFWGDSAPTGVRSRPKFFDKLVQNYPNPFNPTTTIAFSLAENSHVVLAIYDVRGALVRRLLDERRSPGEFRVAWDGRNDAGETVSSGVYFYRLSAGSFSATRKMVLLK